MAHNRYDVISQHQNTINQNNDFITESLKKTNNTIYESFTKIHKVIENDKNGVNDKNNKNDIYGVNIDAIIFALQMEDLLQDNPIKKLLDIKNLMEKTHDIIKCHFSMPNSKINFIGPPYFQVYYINEFKKCLKKYQSYSSMIYNKTIFNILPASDVYSCYARFQINDLFAKMSIKFNDTVVENLRELYNILINNGSSEKESNSLINYIENLLQLTTYVLELNKITTMTELNQANSTIWYDIRQEIMHLVNNFKNSSAKYMNIYKGYGINNSLYHSSDVYHPSNNILSVDENGNETSINIFIWRYLDIDENMICDAKTSFYNLIDSKYTI